MEGSPAGVWLQSLLGEQRFAQRADETAGCIVLASGGGRPSLSVVRAKARRRRNRDHGPTLAAVSSVLKPVDSAWTVVVVDPVAQRLLPVVARTSWLTPLRLTVVAQILGLVSAACFALGWLVVGAVLFEVRFLLDCLDGRLARLRQISSVAGAILDQYGDRVVLSAVIAGVAWSSESPWLGTASMAAYWSYFTFKDLRDDLSQQAGRETLVDRISSGGIGAALRRRRIYPLVTSVDVEHLCFAVAPLVSAIASDDLMQPALAVLCVYFAANAARFAIGSVRTAVSMGDRSTEQRAERGDG